MLRQRRQVAVGGKGVYEALWRSAHCTCVPWYSFNCIARRAGRPPGLSSPCPIAMAAPQKLDVHLEGLSEFQEGAASLKAGEPLSLQQQEGGRLVCATQGGAVVGLVPADKRGLLSRGPWAGTVRSVKRKAAGAAAAGAGGDEPAGATASAADTATAAGAASGALVLAAAALPADPVPEPSSLEAVQGSLGEQQQQQDGPGQPAAAELPQGTEAAAAAPASVVAAVVQLLVRFVPEEQRWQQARQQQQQPEGLPPQQFEDESMARLTTEQFEQLGAYLLRPQLPPLPAGLVHAVQLRCYFG